MSNLRVPGRFRPLQLWVALLVIAVAMATAGTREVTAQTQSGSFNLSGNPESRSGAVWTFQGTVDGVSYDLAGVLMKPHGKGPFPAVIVNHGYGGSAQFLMRIVGPTLRGWGLVCIATNYTFAAGVPIGSPGGPGDTGASPANVLRLHMTYELLRRLGYVDMSRVALHGHSMGAYVEEAAAGAYPNDFRVASTTGGGMRPDRFFAGPAPGRKQLQNVRIPFQLHHGDQDATVPVAYDQHFAQFLAGLGVPDELYLYPGGHLAPRSNPEMFAREYQWYSRFGMFGGR